MESGKILGFRGNWSSGIGHLLLEKEDGGLVHVPCENAPTVRALERAFGGFITPGHTANGAGPVGQWIRYELDDIGMLDGFTPCAEAGL